MDELNLKIADYVANDQIKNEAAYDAARLSLQDALGCAILSLKFADCQKLLGPVVDGTVVPNGARVIGTPYILDPITASFNLGSMIRWLDFNDTWLGKEWAHPSDTIGALLPLADYLSQTKKNFKMRDLLTGIIKAYEIQGTLAISNSFNQIGFDHVIFVKIASAAVGAFFLGAHKNQVFDALSNAWIDTGPIRAYRHFPNTGSRKSWAAGDQAARGLYFAFLTMKGEMGYSLALSAKKWGLYDVLFQGKPFKLVQPLDSHIIENILFKVLYPAEFHAQTAVEAAIQLHPLIRDKWDEIEKIEIETQEPAMRIIDKKGVLSNHADRDHCLQYMVAVAILTGNLKEEDYSDQNALNPLIDALRNKMILKENAQFTKDYYDPKKRFIGNSISIAMLDGTIFGPISISAPLGHPSRRKEATPCLLTKFERNLSSHYTKEKIKSLMELFADKERFENLAISSFVDYFMGCKDVK